MLHTDPTDTPTTPRILTIKQGGEIIEAFKHEVKKCGVKPRTKKYRDMHYDYFTGAIRTLVALGYDVPPMWCICIFSSRDISADNTPL